jgi:hypothetical protein
MKKAQLKIQQMAFMLMAVTLFFVLVGMFVLVFRFSGLRDSATELEEKNAMLLVTKLANSPEFSFGNTKLNCIDADKAMILGENIEKYAGFWGKDVSNIEIHRIYPVSEEVVCNLGNYPNCNIIRMYEGVAGYYLTNFVLLCRKESLEGDIYDKCEIAKVMVGYDEE